ncbi:MAG TPA: hypothetical protein VHP63_06435, partial [candidate division Zixibacteria bacterium]|nr:hypothetical protein [candidate division Zixibacteria bacterium]
QDLRVCGVKKVVINKFSKHLFCIIVLFSIIPLLISSCVNDKLRMGGPFQVKVITPNFLSTIGTIYELDMDSIKVTSSRKAERKVDTVIYIRQLTNREKWKVAAFFSSFPLKDLKNEYTNPDVFDGEQTMFEITIGEISKTIRTYHHYETHLGNLVNFFNSLVDEKCKIRYMKID